MVFRTHEQDQRSLGQLFTDATRETSDLVSKEIELAKLEISDKIANLKTGTASMVIAAALMFAGLLVLLLAAVLALDLALHQPWLSALVIGVGVTLLGGIALLVARQHLSSSALTPRRSVESIREDTRTIQEHLPGNA